MKKEEALKILQTYGDQLLNEEEYLDIKKNSALKEKKFKRVHRVCKTVQTDSLFDNEISVRKKKRMKQKRKKMERHQLSEPNKIGTALSKTLSKVSKRKELLNLKAECKLSSLEMPKAKMSESASVHSECATVVHFKQHAPHKKIISIKQVADDKDKDTTIMKALSMGEVRHHVLKFGISGFDADKKKKTEIDIAIKLGAKPLKRKPMNYKEYLENRKNSVKNKSAAKKSISKVKLLKLDGQLGKFKDGVQFIKHNEIKRINSKQKNNS